MSDAFYHNEVPTRDDALKALAKVIREHSRSAPEDRKAVDALQAAYDWLMTNWRLGMPLVHPEEKLA